MTYLILALASILTSIAHAQNISSTALNQPNILKWRENLKIRYFGEFVGPNLQKWDDNQYNDKGEKTSTPINLYNQLNIQYKILPKTSFILSPRFFNQIGDRNDLRENEDQQSVVLDDWLVGVLREVYKNNKVIYYARLSHRHPLSIASQNNQIDSQVEFQNDFTFLPTNEITVLHWNTYRYYVYEASRNEDRYRINFTTIFNYDFNDRWKIQLAHDLDLQHRAPKYGNSFLNKQDWNYFEKNKNQVALGVGYTPIPSLTVIPFIKELNDEKWSIETTQVGVWFLGKIF